MTKPIGMTQFAAGVAMLMTLMLAPPLAAQQGIYVAGDAIVTGFSGVRPPTGALLVGTSPLDEVLIDLNGDAMKIFRTAAPLDGQTVRAVPGFSAKSGAVGQVFAIALDDRDNVGVPPNIFLGATSAFGIQIVTPDADGDGRPERTIRGAPRASWMPGQFGTERGGGPGAIWRVDSMTGVISLFADLPNSGPGIGDIVFDRTTRQFFVSDLDTGLIHRLNASGAVLDSFDHGTMALPATGLAPIADDGRRMDITSPDFSSEDASTWGFTQKERLVWGMAVRGGRLYYAVAGGLEVWSVGITLEGNFANDPHFEFDALLASPYPITDMSFDARGRLYLAQRGGVSGSYDYVSFAEPARSSVQRYRHELPDDPGTRGTWVREPEDYAIGFPKDYRNASGGLALGYGPNGVCDDGLWSTGDGLRNNPTFAGRLANGGPADVHGLQINATAAVRSQNEPPFSAAFIDYDGRFGDPGQAGNAGGAEQAGNAEQAGHVGDVEIWQSCKGQPGFSSSYSIAPYGDLPADYTPPAYDTFNLSVTKRPYPRECAATNGGWFCHYVVRVTNTGPGAYLGPVTVYELLPGAPAGAIMGFDFQPWRCTELAAHEYECTYPPVLLFPGESLDLFVMVKLPAAFPLCRLENVAAISWPFGMGDAEPDDDIGWGVGKVPGKNCPPPQGKRANLQIDKNAAPPSCWKMPSSFRCNYLVKVTNTGPGIYNGPIQITDTVPLGTTATFSGPSWVCTGGPASRCTHGVIALDPGDSVFMPVRIDVPQALAQQMECRVLNAVKITAAPGGSDGNTDPSDDEDTAAATIPEADCGRPALRRTNLMLEKTADVIGCLPGTGVHHCHYDLRLTNTGPGPYDARLVVRDTVPDGAKATFGDGWTCADAKPDYTCSRKVSLPNPGDSTAVGVKVEVPDALAKQLDCQVRSEARIVFAAGGSRQNTNPGDDAADATATVPGALCNIITVAQVQPSCPTGSRWNGERCERGVILLPVPTDGCRRGYWRSNDHCCQIGDMWNGKRCVKQEKQDCPAGVYPNCAAVDGPRCPPDWSGQPPTCCPPSTRVADGRCVKLDEAEDDRECGRGRYLSDGHCCPRGSVWNGKRCLRQSTLQPECPRGTVGVFPNCRAAGGSIDGQRCPSGTTGTFPNCVPIRTCPQNTVGSYPNCRGIQVQTCPGGTRGRYPNCEPIVRTCPPGTTGVPPLCRRLGGRPCPSGTVGSAGRCLLLQVPRQPIQPRVPSSIELQRQRTRQISPPVQPKVIIPRATPGGPLR